MYIKTYTPPHFHISNGALMYRDVPNDEWLTDAIVLPESMVTTAMEAWLALRSTVLDDH